MPPSWWSTDYDFKDGLFSGYDPAKRAYDKGKWALQRDDKGVPKMDLTLQDKRCVFQLLKKHYSRYTPKLVSEITGTPEEDLLEVYKAYAATGATDKAGTILYAMGWTQHTVGRPEHPHHVHHPAAARQHGGGRRRRERAARRVQRAGLHRPRAAFHILPGYLAIPGHELADAGRLPEAPAPRAADPLSANWWQNEPKYMVSLLKAYFGDKAAKDNEFGYQWLPKLRCRQAPTAGSIIFDDMYNGEIKGFFAWGRTRPAAAPIPTRRARPWPSWTGWSTSTSSTTRPDPSGTAPAWSPAKIKTEVFMLPACVSVEKEGSITNSGRWMQWRYAATKPLGQSRPDGDIILALGNKIRELYQKEGGALPAIRFST